MCRECDSWVSPCSATGSLRRAGEELLTFLPFQVKQRDEMQAITSTGQGIKKWMPKFRLLNLYFEPLNMGLIPCPLKSVPKLPLNSVCKMKS